MQIVMVWSFEKMSLELWETWKKEKEEAGKVVERKKVDVVRVKARV